MWTKKIPIFTPSRGDNHGNYTYHYLYFVMWPNVVPMLTQPCSWPCVTTLLLTPVLFRGATSTAHTSKPCKTPIMAARRRRLLFFKIEVRSRSCWSYHIWRHCCYTITTQESGARLREHWNDFNVTPEYFLLRKVQTWNSSPLYSNPRLVAHLN